MKTVIKICGVTQADTAYQIACAGADYVGLIFAKKSPRCVAIDAAASIADAIRRGGAQPVAVVVEQSLDDIKALCELTGVRIIQLHSDSTRALQRQLPETLERFYVLPVNTAGIICDAVGESQYLDKTRDKILFDNEQAGSGAVINLQQVNRYKTMPFFIAGGLSEMNVSAVVSECKPFGVDASSQLESEPGIKDIERVKHFIQTLQDEG